MGALRERVFAQITENKENIEKGIVNCIPFPIEGMRNVIPGIRQAKYYLMTAQQKTGKTQFSCYVLFSALLYAYEHSDNLRVKLFCFPLEETPELILERFISFCLYHYSKDSSKPIRLTPTDMESIQRGLNEDLYKLITSDANLAKLLDFFEENVIFFDSTNPTGIFKDCEKYAKAHGNIIKKQWTDKEGKIHEVFDHYEQDDPKEYRIVWVDHLGLISGDNGMALRESIQTLSATYFVKLRNQYKFTIWAIQQQMAFDTVDAFKIDKVEPSCTNLSDNKATAKDANMVIALWSPYYMGKDTIGGCDVHFRRLGHYGRILKLLANRDGLSGESFPMYMDGAVSWYDQLNQQNINNYYALAEKYTLNK